MLLLWWLNLEGGSSSGEHRLTAFQEENLRQRGRLDELIRREDEEIIAIIMAAWEIL